MNASRARFHSVLTLSALLVVGATQSARAGYFTVPYDANVFIRPLGGDFGAVTEFGVIDTSGDLIPLFTGLPSAAALPEVSIGFYAAGESVELYMETVWFGQTYQAFSNQNDARSLNAFYDTNNSLGLGGSAIDPLSPITWLLRLDNAASLGIDDDDNDLLIHIRIEAAQAVPEASSLFLVSSALASLVGMAYRRKRKNRQ